jgi:hypothetical protein
MIWRRRRCDITPPGPASRSPMARVQREVIRSPSQKGAGGGWIRAARGLRCRPDCHRCTIQRDPVGRALCARYKPCYGQDRKAKPLPKIDIKGAPTRFASAYPPPLDGHCKELGRCKPGAAAGLTVSGANLMRLAPGQWTGQRHWHTAEDEFVWVVEGEVVLVGDCGEEVLAAGTAPDLRPACPRPSHPEPFEPGGGPAGDRL